MSEKKVELIAKTETAQGGPLCTECGKRCLIFTKIDGDIVCAYCVAKAIL